MAERLAHPLQTAFLKGRRIHDAILAFHEIVHEVASRGHKGVSLKLDFQKAYDRLDWSFLRLVLPRRSFDERWCSWIMQIVQYENTAININGEVGPSGLIQHTTNEVLWIICEQTDLKKYLA